VRTLLPRCPRQHDGVVADSFQQPETSPRLPPQATTPRRRVRPAQCEESRSMKRLRSGTTPTTRRMREKNDLVRASRTARRRTVTRVSANRKLLTRTMSVGAADSNPRPQPCESVLGGFGQLGISGKSQFRRHLGPPRECPPPATNWGTYSRRRPTNEVIVDLAGGWSRLGPASPQTARYAWLGSPASLRFRSDRGWSTDWHL